MIFIDNMRRAHPGIRAGIEIKNDKRAYFKNALLKFENRQQTYNILIIDDA